MNFALTMGAAAGASAVELLEALAIVLAVGVTRGFRDALTGALAAAIGVLTLCLVLGPALRAGAGLSVLRVIVGGALLLFGLEWLRKGVLRVAGRRRRASSYHEFVEARDTAAALPSVGVGRDWGARGLAFQGVFLESLEVGLIVLARNRIRAVRVTVCARAEPAGCRAGRGESCVALSYVATLRAQPPWRHFGAGGRVRRLLHILS